LDGKIEAQVANDFVEKCANGLPVLIATENEMFGPWMTLVVDRLDAEPAAALFKQQSNLTDSSSDTDVYGIVKVLDHTPFAVVIGARGMLASKQTPAQFYPVVKQMAAAANGNGQLAALTASFRALTSALQGLLLMLGATFGGQASLELLSAISGAPAESVQQAMNLLAQLLLVERSQRYGAPYYRLHAITYAFAQSGLRGSNRLDGLQGKVRDALLAYVKKYATADPQAHNKLAAEMENFIAAARWAADKGDRDLANQLIIALTQAGDFANTRGYVYELLQLRGIGTGYTTAFPAYGSEQVAPAAVSTSAPPEDVFAEEEEEYGEEEEVSELPPAPEDLPLLDDITSLRTALVHARRTGDQERQVEILQAIGKAQIGKDMETEAITTYQEALATYEDLKDNVGILEMLDMLSALMVKTENSQAAILHVTRGIKLAQEVDDDETEMQLLITLGDARQQLGESEDSLRAYQQALEIARSNEDTQNEAIILYKLGYAQLDNGDANTAIETWEQDLKLFREQEKRDYEGRVLGGLGTAYGELGRWQEATNFHTSALHIAREVKDKVEESLQLGNLGYASVQANQLGQAVLRYRQALHLNYQSKDRENIVSTIVDLVRLLTQSRRHLSVAELLINDALRLEPNDKDLNQLKEQITADKALATADGVDFVDVVGTAQDYAANAYKLLED
jgi:tetratricopeptide (TPR) repeat protein